MLGRLTISPAGYRRITFVALVALGFIVVTGGAVRVTGSGLGCPDWPTCAEGRIVAPLEYHALVEFVNRTVTGLGSFMVLVAGLPSLRRRPFRRDLVWLAVGLVVGVIGQIVLGGLVVLFDLFPPLVMGHFVLSVILVARAGPAVWILLALALYAVWRAYRDRAPADVLRRGTVLLAVLCAQGAIGYIQYFTHVPGPPVAASTRGA